MFPIYNETLILFLCQFSNFFFYCRLLELRLPLDDGLCRAEDLPSRLCTTSVLYRFFCRVESGQRFLLPSYSVPHPFPSRCTGGSSGHRVPSPSRPPGVLGVLDVPTGVRILSARRVLVGRDPTGGTRGLVGVYLLQMSPSRCRRTGRGRLRLDFNDLSLFFVTVLLYSPVCVRLKRVYLAASFCVCFSTVPTVVGDRRTVW